MIEIYVFIVIVKLTLFIVYREKIVKFVNHDFPFLIGIMIGNLKYNIVQLWYNYPTDFGFIVIAIFIIVYFLIRSFL